MWQINDHVVRLFFFLGISSYSFGITYFYTAKYYLYTSLLYHFLWGSEKIWISIWNGFINSLLCGYYVSLINFVVVLGFLVHCHCMNFVDQWCKIYIPLLNRTFITIQYIHGEYQFTMNETYSWMNIWRKIKDKRQEIKE